MVANHRYEKQFLLNESVRAADSKGDLHVGMRTDDDNNKITISPYLMCR